MRYKGGKILLVVSFLGALLVLREGIVYLQREVPQVSMQQAVISARQIDPTALFYTESRLALQAEKQLSRARLALRVTVSDLE